MEFPQVYAYIRDEFHGGILPLKFLKDGQIRLIVKAPKEMLLTAKVNGQFKIYVIPVEADGLKSFALISAFHDSEVDPLIITTPLFAEPLSELYRETLLADVIDLHLFDVNNVEFLGYRARIECSENIKKIIVGAKFAPYSSSCLESVAAQMTQWYESRGDPEEGDAITISLVESLFPDDFVFIDARPSSNRWTSDKVIYVNQLEREEPGPFQERDIAELFSRIFKPHQIFLNPLRCDDREEIADLIILGSDRILFLQAKDSPNLERVLQNSVSRKRATAIKHLDKGLRQLEGAMKYALQSNTMKFYVGERIFSVRTDKVQLCGAVVMKELFLDDYDTYTKMTMRKCDAVEQPSILLDYAELHAYTMNITDENTFFKAFDGVFAFGKETGMFPRLRFVSK